jgi:hypothetical protein
VAEPAERHERQRQYGQLAELDAEKHLGHKVRVKGVIIEAEPNLNISSLKHVRNVSTTLGHSQAAFSESRLASSRDA